MTEAAIAFVHKVKDALHKLADALDADDARYAKIAGRNFVVNITGGTIVTASVGGVFGLSLLGFSLATVVPAIALVGMVLGSGIGAVGAYTRYAENASFTSHVKEAQAIFDEYSQYLKKQSPLGSCDIRAVRNLGEMIDVTSLVLTLKDGNTMKGSDAMAFLKKNQPYSRATVTFSVGVYVKKNKTQYNSDLTNTIRKRANDLMNCGGIWTTYTLADEKK
ncbi:uncharacterized protein LOC124259791 [Haliotis rubra]|uniref:uncharacterized protein LOC124259791 n=1 Tax=Haliotis rubra TaxID=36100 RepID=UPI001EE5E341|nr:uncharacterized protein LOC124259791 [Haliotis rubra]XP_046549952.1 uncharacterized protein LOC124259791 [Haliotis rubra]XP_046549953.1 uncharacterized protein LOC124259791 [Haliotis rubra]